MNKLDLTQPKRQSPVGMVVIFFKNLRIGINIFVSLFFVQYGFRIDPSSNWLWIAVIVLLVIFAILSVLQYRRFYFYVSGNQMIIEKGVISREKITIPFDRIQSVHINQNIIQRFLNVVGLKIDTAGSAAKEMEIAALERTYARKVQEFLMRMKTQNRDEPEGHEEYHLTEDGDLDIGGEATPLVKLSLGEVLRVGLTENHLRTGLVLFAVVSGYIWQFEEYLKPFEPYLETQKNFLASRWLQLLPFAILLYFIIAILLSLIQSFLRYYGLRFFIDKRGAQLVSGLLKKVEYQIPLHKIQFIKWSSNPLRKLVGLKTIVVKQAGSREASDKQSLKVPGARQEQLEVVQETFFPELKESEFIPFSASRFLILQQSSLYGVLPALMLAGLGFVETFFWSVAALWLITAVYLAYRFQPTVQLACNKEMILLSRGWIFPQTAALKYFKIQNVQVSQNIFQKKRNLVHLNLFTAAGSLRMPQMDAEQAREVYNYVLYQIESTCHDWM